jgi:hypothetical protein
MPRKANAAAKSFLNLSEAVAVALWATFFVLYPTDSVTLRIAKRLQVFANLRRAFCEVSLTPPLSEVPSDTIRGTNRFSGLSGRETNR